ncbi:ATP-binding protein [Bifidobacterium panos]|uniref:ATP-dependent DNA helicase RecG n=1 Tax=Bifidobacterium panos TaxID=2675321 RepID=A0ABX1SYC2_9BIFI|nr:ATP-binding protein [Bifidobacterium sp. DSM 109963]NMN02350.1 ATP-dependent DNA helicase RecG [Bifidobacterium sp. DSM 109963]
MVQPDEVARFSRMPEGQYFDRKSARIKPEDAVRHVIAFANASGGQLVIGIEDDGTVTGFRRENAKPIESFEQLSITLCAPAPVMQARRIPCVNAAGEDDVALVLDVAPSSNHVVEKRLGGDVYLREADKSVRLNREQVRALEYDKGQLCFEDEPVRGGADINDVDHEFLARYKRVIGAENMGDERLLEARDFLRGGQLTNAGVILFAADPMRFLPSAWVRVLRVDGTELRTGRNLNITKDVEFSGPLVNVVERAGALIEALLRDFQVLDDNVRFKTVSEYPRFAWFEGLVNAVAHRDYSLQGDYTRVMIFDDRMEITSPGTLPNRVTLENMRTTRFARNPKICHVLTSFEMVRELNEGVHRMYEEMDELGLPAPEFSEPSGMVVKLVLRNDIVRRVPYVGANDIVSRDGSHQSDNRDFTDVERMALDIVARDGKVITRTLAQQASVSTKTAFNALDSLAGRGLLAWHGSSRRDPRQYYSAK